MLYYTLRFLAWILFKLWNRLEVTGLEHVPEKGKLIVVANHVSFLDPIVAGASISRQIRFMAKKELFEAPALKWIIPALGAFQVDRDKTDFQAVKNALKVLANKEALGIFPEGGTRKGAKEITFRHGAAAIALKSQSPVLPVGIKGTHPFSRVLLFGKIKVYIGSVISWPENYQGRLQDDDIIRLTKEMEQAVQLLKSS